MISRLARTFALPDLLLAGWVGVAQPVLFTASAAPTESLLSGPGNGLLGALYVAAAAGAVAALVTRDADLDAADPAGRTGAEYELGLAGPTATGVMLVLVAGFDLLGVAFLEWLMLVVFIAAFAGAFARSRMPPLPGATRRLLVTPFVVVAAGIFDQVITTAAELLDVRLLGEIRTSEDLALALSLAGIGVAFAGFFYLMLILAPRRLAGDRAEKWTWIARYVLFVVSVVVGVIVGSAVGGTAGRG